MPAKYSPSYEPAGPRSRQGPPHIRTASSRVCRSHTSRQTAGPVTRCADMHLGGTEPAEMHRYNALMCTQKCPRSPHPLRVLLRRPDHLRKRQKPVRSARTPSSTDRDQSSQTRLDTQTYRLTAWIHLRDTSSFKTCATTSVAIRSRAPRSCMPTLVTPIGHAALPIDRRRYASLAFWYWRCCDSSAISPSLARTSRGIV